MTLQVVTLERATGPDGQRHAATQLGVKLPEPDGWIGASDLDPDAGVEGYTAATVREFTADQVRAAVLEERERCARVIDAEIARAEELVPIEEDGRPVFDQGQMDAGICALRTVAAAIRSGHSITETQRAEE